eukprot:200989_1
MIQQKKPKYLSVSWLSCFPNEDEKLFYGSYVMLQISNITEATNLRHHAKELEMLNKFQKIIQNQIVGWNKDKDQHMVHALEILITNQQKYRTQPLNDNNQQQQKKSTYITDYGARLFRFFCHHQNTTKVCIRHFESLPK